jgi:hypothetical protein
VQLRAELACTHEMAASSAGAGRQASGARASGRQGGSCTRSEPGCVADLLHCYIQLQHSPGMAHSDFLPQLLPLLPPPAPPCPNRMSCSGSR